MAGRAYSGRRRRGREFGERPAVNPKTKGPRGTGHKKIWGLWGRGEPCLPARLCSSRRISRVGGGGDATVEKNDAPKAIDWHFPPRGNFGQGFLDGGLNLTLRPPQ